MPQSKNRLTGHQWRVCDRCGFNFPLPELSSYQGMMICTRCTDDPTAENRDEEIARILGEDVEEGTDTRWNAEVFNDEEEVI